MPKDRFLEGASRRIRQEVDQHVDKQLEKSRAPISTNSEAFTTRRDFRLGEKGDLFHIDELFPDITSGAAIESDVSDKLWGERVSPIDVAAERLEAKPNKRQDYTGQLKTANKLGSFLRRLVGKK